MIPISLTLQGLYSYQAKQTIDFTRLTQAGIFGIFGSVGSGKSTILEAITFALYGKTDRLNLSGDNRNYNMMNLKSNEMYIEFTFRSGNEDVLYMATVKGRRNSKQFEDVKTLERFAYRKENEAWIPIPVETLENIIGLSYENFKRTIIIPQGKFQEFLQLSDKDRTQMMKELFNLNKYEFFYKVVALEAANNEEKQLCTGNLQQLGEVRPEQITELQTNITLLREDIEKQSEKLQTLQLDITEQQQLKEITEKLKEQERILAQLKEQEAQIISTEDTIRKFEDCTRNFKNLLDLLLDITNKVVHLEKTILEDDVKKTALSGQQSELISEFQIIQKEYDNKDILKQQAQELEKIIRMRLVQDEIDKLQLRISNGQKTMEALSIQTTENKKKLDETSLTLKLMKTQLPDFNQLSTIKNWHTVNKHLKDDLQSLTKEFELAQKEMETLLVQKVNLCTGSLFTKTTTPIEPNGVLLFLENQKHTLKKKTDELDTQMTHLQLQAQMEKYAEALENGKPCPLCGSMEHPHIAGFMNVTEAQQQIKSQKSDIEKVVMDIDQHQLKLTTLIATLDIRNDQLQKYTTRQKEQLQQIEIHRQGFVWDTYQDEEAILQAFKNAEILQHKIEQEEKTIELINKKRAEIDDQKNRFGEGIEKIKHQATAFSAEYQTLTELLTLYKPEQLQDLPIEGLQQEIDKKLQAYATLEKKYITLQEKIKIIQAETDILSGKLEVNKMSLSRENLAFLTVKDKIQQQILWSEYQSEDEIKEILSSSVDVALEKIKIAAYHQKVAVAHAQQKTLITNLADRNYIPAFHQQIIEQHAQLTASLNMKNQELGRSFNELKDLLIRTDKRLELMKKLEALEARAENIKTLKQLFKASGFVNYISSVYLHELCYTANERFSKLTRQKLSLEVTDDNNFQVRDFMNGGKVRSVKTLSGGQTFQAALSLALALADNIQKITVSKQNFFFLDEGFGSLDKESLDIVFDTLKTLRKENRIVGIISHVEEMQQEIDNHLKIVNDEDRGSLVYMQ